MTPSTERGSSISIGGSIQLLGFCTFEACVGIFWPSIMKMRSQYIPEEARSTIMNFFRIPLNIFVCVVLYNVSFKRIPLYKLQLMKFEEINNCVAHLKVNAFPITIMFGMCSIFLFMASVLQRRLMIVAESQKPSKLSIV